MNTIKSHLSPGNTGFILFFSIIYISFSMNMPVAIYTVAAHDDALFWVRAWEILKGNWLGDYTQMTLSKGPGFSLFLALSAAIGIPITLSISILYLSACLHFFKTLHLLGTSIRFSLVVFLFILFIPETFPSRIIRDNIYPAITLLVFSSLFRILFLSSMRKAEIILYGLCLGFFWTIREEGIWILPGILTVCILSVLKFYLGNEKSFISVIFKRISLFTMSALIFTSIIATINFSYYESFSIVDFKGRYFSKALQALNSIQVENEMSHVPVQKAKREIAYTVSPSFALLMPYFESSGKYWTNPGCGVYPWTCGDYAGGWFMWALRDGVANLGHYSSAKQAEEFYKQIYEEIKLSCDKEIIHCKTNYLPFLPKLSKDQLNAIPSKLINSIDILSYKNTYFMGPDLSMDPIDKLDKIRLFLRYPLSSPSPSENVLIVNGWFYQHRDSWFTLTCNNTNVEVPRLPSMDIARAFEDTEANNQRFSISIPRGSHCIIHNKNNALDVQDIINRGPGAYNIADKSTLYIDGISYPPKEPIINIAIKLKNYLAVAYKHIIPPFFYVGFIIFLIFSIVLVIFRKQVFSNLYIVCAGLWALTISRIMILVLVDISSFPALNSLYFGPAFPLSTAAAVLSPLLLINLYKLFLTYRLRITKCN